MKFEIGRRYWSDDKHEMTVVNRFDKTGLIRCELGFGMPANYKIKKDSRGEEYITVKGRIYRSFP